MSECLMGKKIGNLGDKIWESHLDQKLDLR